MQTSKYKVFLKLAQLNQTNNLLANTPKESRWRMVRNCNERQGEYSQRPHLGGVERCAQRQRTEDKGDGAECLFLCWDLKARPEPALVPRNLAAADCDHSQRDIRAPRSPPQRHRYCAPAFLLVHSRTLRLRSLSLSLSLPLVSAFALATGDFGGACMLKNALGPPGRTKAQYRATVQ